MDYIPCEARRQDEKNRQNSIDDFSELMKSTFRQAQQTVWDCAYEEYTQALAAGIAKECARMLLPLNTKTRMYMKGSVRSWIHYLQVRCAPDTQKEHRDIANECKSIFCANFPTIAKALDWLPNHEEEKVEGTDSTPVEVSPSGHSRGA
jgi:thymidylate synthase (FAD)